MYGKNVKIYLLRYLQLK